MNVNMVFASEARYDKETGIFHLAVVAGVGFPVRIPQVIVFADIDIDPQDDIQEAIVFVRMMDPEGREVARSELKVRPVATNPFDGHGQIALLTALEPNFESRGVYVAELLLNGKCVHTKRYQVGT